MFLSRSILPYITNKSIVLPKESVYTLPEKVLQFGTGVLLRALPDYFIEKANREGIFNGRIVVVKSTSTGDHRSFAMQDHLYTLCVRAVERNQKKEEDIIHGCISRVLNASTEWKDVLKCAHIKTLQIIISNTTETGLQLVKESIELNPPSSFPAKLLAFLHERFRAFGNTLDSGMIIIPTELIPDNGRILQSYIMDLAAYNKLSQEFIDWLIKENSFCSSLVDRIVPGKPSTDVQAAFEKDLGYSDNLLVVAESYRLWAIEGTESIKTILTFEKADEGIIIQPDISLFRELKLRLLNGTHTLTCGLAFLAGYQTVKDAMEDQLSASYIMNLLKQELAFAIPYKVDPSVISLYGDNVLDRFRNPFIQHPWINITLQYSSKMSMRCIPVLLQHYQQYQHVPELFALGFSAYLYFMKPVKVSEGKYFGELNGNLYHIQDDKAAVFYKRWIDLPPDLLVKEVLADQECWKTDLNVLPGFAHAVTRYLEMIMEHGMKQTLQHVLSDKMVTA